MSHNLVLLRHGQSQWNLENRFTGWVDVDLSAQGIEEAQTAGRTLVDGNYHFDIALTSLLKRSIHTLWIVLHELDQVWLPVRKDWRLNERHYGALQGLNKSDMSKLHGPEQVQRWRRGYTVRPPVLAAKEFESLRKDPKYQSLETVPNTESLADTFARVVDYWETTVQPLLQANQRLLIVAHGNTLRALVKYLDDVSDEQITSVNIPTGIPLVYRLDEQLNAIEHHYLAPPDVVDRAASEVACQSTTQS